MAIAYSSAGAGAGTESTGVSLDLVCPATVNANDILIAHVLHTGTSTGPSTPAGWSLLYGPQNVGITTVQARHWCFGKLAVGNEDGATVGFGTDGGTNGRAGRIYSFTGYVSGALADLVPAASFSSIAHDTDPQGPTVMTTVAGALAVALTCQDDNNTEEAIASASGGSWGGFVTFVSTGLGPQGLHIDIQVATPTANPGTISGGAMVAANDEAGTIGFEIRPNLPPVTGNGILSAQASAAGGAGITLSLGSGNPAAQAVVVAGAGVSASAGTGVLTAQAAAAVGVGSVSSGVSGSGALVADAATLIGIGTTLSIGPGILAAAGVDAEGVGISLSAGVGALLASASVCAGAGLSSSLGSGVLAAAAAHVSGSQEAPGAAAWRDHRQHVTTWRSRWR